MVTAQALTPLTAPRLGTQTLSDPDTGKSLIVSFQPQASSSGKSCMEKRNQTSQQQSNFLKMSVSWAWFFPLFTDWDCCLRQCPWAWFYEQNFTPKTQLQSVVMGGWHPRRRQCVAHLPTPTSETDGSVRENQKKSVKPEQGHGAVKWLSVDLKTQFLIHSCSPSPFFVLEVSTCDGPITHGPASCVCPHVLLTLVARQAP